MDAHVHMQVVLSRGGLQALDEGGGGLGLGEGERLLW